MNFRASIEMLHNMVREHEEMEHMLMAPGVRKVYEINAITVLKRILAERKQIQDCAKIVANELCPDCGYRKDI